MKLPTRSVPTAAPTKLRRPFICVNSLTVNSSVHFPMRWPGTMSLSSGTWDRAGRARSTRARTLNAAKFFIAFTSQGGCKGKTQLCGSILTRPGRDGKLGHYRTWAFLVRRLARVYHGSEQGIPAVLERASSSEPTQSTKEPRLWTRLTAPGNGPAARSLLGVSETPRRAPTCRGQVRELRRPRYGGDSSNYPQCLGASSP